MTCYGCGKKRKSVVLHVITSGLSPFFNIWHEKCHGIVFDYTGSQKEQFGRKEGGDHIFWANYILKVVA